MMRIGFVQTVPVIGDLEGNRRRLLAAAGRLDADLIVLPELCQSGYVFTSRDEARALAEPVPDGPTCQALATLARERAMTIVAGICERTGSRTGDGAVYNSAVVLSPAGYLGTYRKLHLFNEEKLWFTPGDTPLQVFELPGGFRAGVMICYDWRFPEAARALTLLGADVIAHPANLVLPYCQEVMRARCIENRVFAVTANRAGTDARDDGRRMTFTGRSQVVSPDGEVLVRAADAGEEAAVVEVDPEMARRKAFNDYNHLLADRRPEFYRGLVEIGAASGAAHGPARGPAPPSSR